MWSNCRRLSGWGLAALLTGLIISGAPSARAQDAPPPSPAVAASPAPEASPAAAPAATATPDPKDVAGAYAIGVAADAATASGNITGDDLKNPEKIAEGVGQNRVAINMMWTLLTGFLVMFMQAGFAMVETGFCRAKHAAHVMMTNFLIYPIGMIGFWICGFAFMFGSLGTVPNLGLNDASVLNGGNPFIGTKGFFLMGEGLYNPAIYALFLFQMVFMDTTCTIPTGAMAERWKFSAFVVYGFFISMVIYPIYGHWVWGGGWLSTLWQNGMGHGAADFAGSGVVHSVGGFVALAGAIVIGPRLGKYGKDGKPRPIPGHNLPMAIIGTFILAFGWFGFNPGSTLGMSGGGNMRAAIVATNTMIASAGGAMFALAYWWLRFKKPDPSMCVNGMLAGLVAITAPCAFTNSICSFIIGAIAGILVCIAVPLVENAGIDDPVGAFSVHGVNGIWGVLSIGIFADGTFGKGWNLATGELANRGVVGILFDPAKGMGQLEAQAISAITCMAWSFALGFLFFKVQHMVMGIRSKESEELEGLDLPETGAQAYPHEEDYAHLRA